MFDPTVMILQWRRVRVIRHEGHDYHVTPPAPVRFNPFRLEVCLYLDPKSGPTWRINRKGRAWFHISNAIYRFRKLAKASRPPPLMIATPANTITQEESMATANDWREGYEDGLDNHWLPRRSATYNAANYDGRWDAARLLEDAPPRRPRAGDAVGGVMATNIDQMRASFDRAESASGYWPLTYWAVENVPALLDDNARLLAEIGEWKACLRVNMLRAGFSDQDITAAIARATAPDSEGEI